MDPVALLSAGLLVLIGSLASRLGAPRSQPKTELPRESTLLEIGHDDFLLIAEWYIFCRENRVGRFEQFGQTPYVLDERITVLDWRTQIALFPVIQWTTDPAWERPAHMPDSLTVPTWRPISEYNISVPETHTESFWKVAEMATNGYKLPIRVYEINQ